MSGKKDKISLPNFIGSVVSRVKKTAAKAKRRSNPSGKVVKSRTRGRSGR